MKSAMIFGQLITCCSLFLASQAAAQANYTATKTQRGSSVWISESVIINYCGDFDGCTMRLGMYDWDGTQRTASREFLFFYNPTNRNWRASNDAAGANYNGVTEHVYNAWSCYVTDGDYYNWSNSTGDPDSDFSLLSWDQYNAECRLTILD